jgi:ATP-dependent Lon protease
MPIISPRDSNRTLTSLDLPEWIPVIPLQEGHPVLQPGIALQISLPGITSSALTTCGIETGKYVAFIPWVHTTSPSTGANETSSSGKDAASNFTIKAQSATSTQSFSTFGCLGEISQINTIQIGDIKGSVGSAPSSLLLVHGVNRIQIQDIREASSEGGPLPWARVNVMQDSPLTTDRDHLLIRRLRLALRTFIRDPSMEGALTPGGKRALLTLIDKSDPTVLVSLIAITLPDIPWFDRVCLLGMDLIDRIEAVSQFIQSALSHSHLKQELNHKVTQDLTKRQREAFLRHQLAVLQKELDSLENWDEETGEKAGKFPQGSISGSNKGSLDEIRDLQRRFNLGTFPEEIATTIQRDLKRARSMNPAHAEYHTLVHHVDWMLSTPWTQLVPTNNIDLEKSRHQLNQDHHGLESVKKRLIEYLAVLKLHNTQSHSTGFRAPILCLHGPPGVGKTSLGKSIANAMGRPFARIALGGVRDEAELRGHRRTYVGAMPGIFVQTLKKVGYRNPVILLDEIDKLSQEMNRGGNPAAVMLEVLDPEQNHTFTDHYLATPLDLSQVIFIATCNSTKNIPRALLDRMELVDLPGYAPRDKLAIAQRLLQKQITMHGLPPNGLIISDAILQSIIDEYTREPGVRDLDRTMAAICRRAAVKYAEACLEKPFVWRVEVSDIKEVLGGPKFAFNWLNSLGQIATRPGMAIGLAWTGLGIGMVQLVEAVAVPVPSGSTGGGIHLTGRLGRVLRESAQLAVVWVRSHARVLGVELPERLWRESDLHIHLPAGAISKDGPSAGVALVAALVSLALVTPLNPSIAMTGEIGLHGQVLPVGGIAEKSLAAFQHHIHTVIIPKGNEMEWEETVPEEIKKKMRPIFVSHVVQALRELLLNPPDWIQRGDFNDAGDPTTSLPSSTIVAGGLSGYPSVTLFETKL